MEITKESKTLKEAKEALPISFLTDFISKGWEEVGYMKADIEAIKDAYKGTAEIAEVIQQLIDAYLVCIGQLEAHLSDKKYIEYPEDSKLSDAKNESLNEDVDIHVSSDKVEISDEAGEKIAEAPIETPCEGPACNMPPAEAEIKPIADDPLDEPFEFDGPELSPEGDKPTPVGDTFDYFVDFDEPIGEPVSEKDLYGEGDEPIENEKIDDGIPEEDED